jgi:hypothetical protein
LSPRQSETPAALRRIGCFEKHTRKTRDLTRRNEPAGLAGNHQVFSSLDGRANHWPRRSHCLKYGVRHPFPERRLNQNIGRLEQRWNVIANAKPVNPAAQADPAIDLIAEPALSWAIPS